MELWSDAFSPDASMPKRYTIEGGNWSPPLRWAALPALTRELCLVLEDSSEGRDQPFVHWVVYGIPPDLGGLPENLALHLASELPGVRHGVNSLGNTGYDGPAPMTPGRHHYHFRLFALDRPVAAEGPLDTVELLRAIAGHVVDEADLHAIYER